MRELGCIFFGLDFANSKGDTMAWRSMGIIDEPNIVSMIFAPFRSRDVERVELGSQVACCPSNGKFCFANR